MSPPAVGHGVSTELTLLRTAGGGILTKRIALGEDRRPKADGSACRLTTGRATRHRMNGADPAGALAGLLDTMSSDVALTLGRIGEGVDGEAIVVTAKRRAEYAEGELPVITRTLDCLGWSDGPGWVLVDHDRNGMPAEVRQNLERAGGFEPALPALITGYQDAARVVRASTSAGIFNAGTGERFPGSGGLHVYLLLLDQADARRFLKALHKRAWIAGLGWYMVGAAGQLLERSIVDVSVGSPERLVFEGAPVVVPPLA